MYPGGANKHPANTTPETIPHTDLSIQKIISLIQLCFFSKLQRFGINDNLYSWQFKARADASRFGIKTDNRIRSETCGLNFDSIQH